MMRVSSDSRMQHGHPYRRNTRPCHSIWSVDTRQREDATETWQSGDTTGRAGGGGGLKMTGPEPRSRSRFGTVTVDSMAVSMATLK